LANIGLRATFLPVKDDLPILVVEDLQTDVTLLQMALKRCGITRRVNVVSDGLEATKYLQGADQYVDRARFPFPDILFTDLKMPRMDGFELLAWLKAHPKCAVIPVIVLTASGIDDDIRRAYQLGANAYLVKPHRLEDLADMMRSALEFWAWSKKPNISGC